MDQRDNNSRSGIDHPGLMHVLKVKDGPKQRVENSFPISVNTDGDGYYVYGHPLAKYSMKTGALLATLPYDAGYPDPIYVGYSACASI